MSIIELFLLIHFLQFFPSLNYHLSINVNPCILITKGDNNYLPFQKTNKSIDKQFQDRHEKNFWSIRIVQKYYISINLDVSINQYGILSHVPLEALGWFYLKVRNSVEQG